MEEFFYIMNEEFTSITYLTFFFFCFRGFFLESTIAIKRCFSRASSLKPFSFIVISRFVSVGKFCEYRNHIDRQITLTILYFSLFFTCVYA